MSTTFIGLTDLVNEKVGGKVLSCNDDFFAEKENLIKSTSSIFIEEKFTNRGKWMDGWETRRRRTLGHDWVILELGMPGEIKAVNIDTSHFKGNNAAYAAVDGCVVTKNINPDEMNSALVWEEILSQVPLKPDQDNLALIHSEKRFTHVRLRIYPDGGVARFRIYGEPLPDFDDEQSNTEIDLASILSGGQALACSDMFFSHMDNLIMPYKGVNMGDGWETKRRRGVGYDWVVLKLGFQGTINKVLVDTNHFKGNFPDSCTIEYCNNPFVSLESLLQDSSNWKILLPETKLTASAEHLLESEIEQNVEATHLRLNIFPDGGISRLRVLGKISPKKK